jgi:hypothetical protein
VTAVSAARNRVIPVTIDGPKANIYLSLVRIISLGGLPPFDIAAIGVLQKGSIWKNGGNLLCGGQPDTFDAAILVENLTIYY